MLTLLGGNESAMRISRYLVIFLAAAAMLRVQAQNQPAPATDASKTQSAQPQDQGAKPAETGPAVDAAKVKGSTFDSQYFKFTYELPKGWKALDDAVRVSANQMAAQIDKQEAEDRAAASAKRLTNKTTGKRNPAAAVVLRSTPESYSLMVASSNPVESLASPVLPRINIWARKRVPPLDSAADHAQFLLTGKHVEVTERPHDVSLDGRTFVRVGLITADGTYESQLLAVMGDYLVGFDFRADSKKELGDILDTAKTIKFK